MDLTVAAASTEATSTEATSTEATSTPALPSSTSAPRGQPEPRWFEPVVVSVVVTIAYTMFAAWQWSQLAVKSWDLSIFTQLLQRYAALQEPIVAVKGDGFNLLGDHFHPLLAIVAPVYALFPHAFTLLVIQAVCFGVAAGLLTRTAIRRLGVRTGILLGLAFGLSWGLQYAAEAQFHEIALAVPLLMASLCAILESRWRAAVLWAAPLVFVKEDIGLTVVAIGILIAVRARKPLGLWLAVWGLSWFALATMVILPALNPSGEWAYAGNANPIAVLSDVAGLFDPSKGQTLLLLVVVTGGLLLRSPIALVLIPTLAWRFLSTNNGYWGPTWHYSAILMPIAFAALLDGIILARRGRWAWLRVYSRYAAPVSVTVAVLLLPFLPLRTIVTPTSWSAPERGSAAAAVLRSVPDGATVETDVGLMSYLVGDHLVYWIGNTDHTPDCILIDRQAGGTPAEWGDVLAVATRLHPTTSYTLDYDSDGYQLACLGPAETDR